ncbi:hypothetical protein NDU88_001138 [Pleurodeles waltl]|uniref:Uncharacterized protein n=1 Tax=Pleurodeles waltl TaxID=8319 RepID=A0AAV7W067_PLEWA|nr:hypothetical protein NDU88_001138 [Pleurodeles waltl]
MQIRRSFTEDPRWRPAVPADSDQPSSPPRLIAAVTSAPTPLSSMLRARILGSFCGAATRPGCCAARPAIPRRAADCAAGRALQGWPLPCLVFTDVSGGACFIFMVPKAIRRPRMSRGKFNLESIGAKKEKKQPAPLLKDQAGARGRGMQQSALVMKKTAKNAAQVHAIFTQTVKPKRTPPQKELCNAQSGTLEGNKDQVFFTGTGARGTASPEKTDQAVTPLLELIYRTMVHNHEQAQKENRKAKVANRQRQSSIRKVVKSCQDISTRIASIETRTEVLETEVKAIAVQTVAQEQQILDIQWKQKTARGGTIFGFWA